MTLKTLATKIHRAVLLSPATWMLTITCVLTGAGPELESLKIVEPKNGAVVAPGKFKVRVSTHGHFTKLGVIGGDPLGDCVMLPVRHTCSIQVPYDAEPGINTVTATGVTSAGEDVDSEPVEIDIERSTPPLHVEVSPAHLIFTTLGVTLPLSVIGTYSHGVIVELNKSTRTTFSSQNPIVAVVNREGRVTALQAGTTKITVDGTYGVEIQVTPQRHR